MTNLGAQEKKKKSQPLSHLFNLILIPEGGSWLSQSLLSDSTLTRCFQFPRTLKLCANNHLVLEKEYSNSANHHQAWESTWIPWFQSNHLSLPLQCIQLRGCKWTAAQLRHRWRDWGLIPEWKVKSYSRRPGAQLKTLVLGKNRRYRTAVQHRVLTVWPYCKSSSFCVTTNWAFLFFTTRFPSNLDKTSALAREDNSNTLGIHELTVMLPLITGNSASSYFQQSL